MKIVEKEQAIKLRIEERLSLKEISEKLNISKGTASLWLRDHPLTTEEITNRHTKSSSPKIICNPNDNIKKGKAAELIFSARCLLNGLVVFSPLSEDSRIDLVVADTLLRVQVKVFNKKQQFSVRKVGVNSKTNCKIYRYSANDVDFFGAVDLTTFDVYIVPIQDIVEYSSCMSRSAIEAKGYKKNDFSLLKIGRSTRI